MDESMKIGYLKKTSSSTVVKRVLLAEEQKKKSSSGGKGQTTLPLHSYTILNAMIQANRINNTMPFGHRLPCTAGTFQQC